MQPRPGDFGLSRIGGPTGLLVRAGQFVIGDGQRFTHAFIVTDAHRVLEARPGGAAYRPLSHYVGRAVFSTNAIDLTPAQRERIVWAARGCLGVGYSFLDYLAIGLHRTGADHQWLHRYIDSTGHMICSQLVHHCYLVAGVDLSPRHRPGQVSQDITPGELSMWLGQPNH